MEPLNLFYSEPDFDRWIPLDRFPRRVVRRIVRGPHRPGGQMRVFLNLLIGLDRIGQAYRVNNHRHVRNNPAELCCILGKRHVLDGWKLTNPLMVGPCLHNHPIDDPNLGRHRIKRILVPGEWMRLMCAPSWGNAVVAWPIGIDTERWSPTVPAESRDLDVLVYDKIRWDRDRRLPELMSPIYAELSKRGLRHATVRYGSYDPENFRNLLRRSRAMVFVCEHETQGIAYAEALACDVPVIAWEHGGAWTDPEYYPDRVNFSPVSAVPYWDERCGVKFGTATDFPDRLDEFSVRRSEQTLHPREYVLEHLTLQSSATAFVNHARAAIHAPDGQLPLRSAIPAT
jgi:hypothetical protein